MKTIEMFAAQFPAMKVSDDCVEMMNNELYAYSGLFRKMCELEMQTQPASDLIRPEYSSERLMEKTQQMEQLNKHLDALMANAGAFSSCRPNYAKQLLAPQNQAQFIEAVHRISNAAIVLSRLENTVRTVAERKEDSRQLNDRLAVARAKAEIRWQAIKKEAEQLRI